MTEAVDGRRGGKRQQRQLAQPLARLLLDAIDDPVRGTVPFAAYPGISAAELHAAVSVHKIAPAVYLHLKNANAPDDVVAPLHEHYQHQIVRQLRLQADLALVAVTLDDANLAWAAMKGPVLAERLWARPDLRQYNDLDVLVERRKFGQVLGALVAAGARMVDRNWALIAGQLRGEVSLELPNGTALDLHWHVVNSAQLRRMFTFRTDDMLRRAVELKVGDVVVPALDPVDTLLHLGYHTAHSGGHRLVWLKDVERATADADLDWHQTLERARAYGVALPLAVVLARTQRVLGFAKPPPRAALKPAYRTPWGVFAAIIDATCPAPTLPTDRLSGQIAFKNTRSTSAGSLKALLGSLKERGGPAFNPDENPLYVDAGGEAARSAYLRVVEGGREP